MIAIDNHTAQHDQLLEWYYKQLKKFYKIGVKGKRSNLANLVLRNAGRLHGRMFEYFETNLEQIVKAKPVSLKQWQADMLTHVGFTSGNGAHEGELEVFNRKMGGYYSSFFQRQLSERGISDSNGRWMVRKLGLNVCVYCNHNYTLTLSGRNGNLKPAFDHFFPKSKFPLLALSFYNLVPICSTCNTLKGDEELVHSPYDDSLDFPRFYVYGTDPGAARVLFGLGQGLKGIEIDTDANYTLAPGQQCNVSKLKIKQVYSHQIDYVQEILDAAQQYNMGSYDGLIEDFQALGKQPAEIERIIWGYYRDNHQKRPLSKLTQDVLEQIGMKGV